MFDDGEHSECNPIDEPFRVINFCTGFNGMYRNVGWVYNSDDVAEQLGTITEYQI